MNNKNNTSSGALTLRQKAKALLKELLKKGNLPSSETEMLKLIHELQVHQIELEMQNEELVVAKKSIEALAIEKYKEYYDFAPSGYITLNKLGDIMELNFSAAGMLGKERQKLINNRFALFISKETLAGFNHFIQNVFTSKVKQTCEVIISTESNPALTEQVLPIYVNIDGIVSQNDELCLLTLNDITESIRVKKELEVSEEKYRMSEFHLKKAQLISHLGNWVLNVETNELLWSDEIYRIFDCEPLEFKATYEAFLGFIHPDDREKVNAAYLKSLETKTEYQIEHRIITKNNQIKYVREKCLTTFNNQGKPLNSFGVVIDVTEQKALENELIKAKEHAVESEEKLRILFETCPDGITLTKLSGEIVETNKAMLQQLGLTSEEFYKTNFTDITPPKWHKAEQECIATCMQTKKPQYFEKEFIKKNGKIYPVALTGWIINDKHEKPKYLGAFVKDITERKQAENDINKAKEKVEESETRFNLAMKASSDGLFDWNIETNEIYYSPAWKKMLGYEDAELPNDFSVWEKTTKPEDVKKSWELQQKLITKQTDRFVMEFKMKHKDGHWIDVLSRAEAFFNDSGKAVRMVGTHTDITERKSVEEALRKSEDRLRTAREAMLDSFLIFTAERDEQGEITDFIFEEMNANAENMLQLSGKQLIGKRMCEELPVNRTNGFFEKYKKVVETGIPLEEEFYLPETHIPAAWYYHQVVRCNDGLAISHRDITERKMAEQELIKAKVEAEENEQQYRMLFNSNRDSISILSIGTDGKPSGFIEFNPIACEMFDFTREELLLKKLEELEAPVPENVMIQRLETLHTKGRVDFETIIRDKAGNEIDVEVKVVVINYQNQPALMNITRDITVRKKAEQELIAAKEHAENNNRINVARLKLLQFSENHTIDEILEETLNTAEIITHSKIGFFHFVEQDQNNLSLQNWSTATKKYYCNAQGKGLHYPIEKAGVWADCVSERKPVIHNNYEALKHKKGLPEGHAALIRELVVPIIYDDVVKAIFGIGNKETEYNQIDVENISLLAYLAWEIVEKKRISEALVSAKEKAEESDRLKSAFLANMSHEIRTPMNGILGFADLLKEPGLTGDEQQNYIEIIEKSGKRMLNIINDIVDISKIEAGLMKTDINESNVNEQIEYIYTFFKPEAEAKRLKLSFRNTLPQKEAIIKTDREKLYAVLINLVKNAIKYTKEGSIEFGYDLVVETQCIASLQFYVKDTGIGIPKNRQEAIFERFIQADIADKMAYQGAGLGLAISKAYVEMLGGKIHVESEEGMGSTFYFTLPYNAEPVKETTDQQSELSGSNYDFGKLKILVAEDDEVSVLLIDTYIKMVVKDILKAGSGIEAVEVCRNNPDIDLILMDIRMPNMDGYEATKLIRQFNPEVVIIAQTAHGLTGDREKALIAGCNDYISKPFNKSDLLNLLNKYLK